MISPTMKNNRLCFASNSCFFFSSLASNGRCFKKNGKRFSCFDVHFDAINTSFENCSSCFVASVCFFLFFYFSLHLPRLVLLYPIEPSKISTFRRDAHTTLLRDQIRSALFHAFELPFDRLK